MDIKKSLKINYKLGSNYLLFPTTDGWVLMRSGSYRPIMNSNENTEEELERFVKEHREYNALAVIRLFALIANLIVLALCFANIYNRALPLAGVAARNGKRPNTCQTWMILMFFFYEYEELCFTYLIQLYPFIHWKNERKTYTVINTSGHSVRASCCNR